MTTRQASEDYARRFTEMSANRDRDALNIALEIKALVQLRIQTRGYNFEETPFVPYTKAYAKRREDEGYQTEYVDFTRTGRLWANVRPEVAQSTPTVTTVEITARDEGNQAKLRGAVRKRGNILLISDPEADILTRLNQQRVNRYFQ
jgi:hypothetical protein